LLVLAGAEDHVFSTDTRRQNRIPMLRMTRGSRIETITHPFRNFAGGCWDQFVN
jgi:hypothetical protein